MSDVICISCAKSWRSAIPACALVPSVAHARTWVLNTRISIDCKHIVCRLQKLAEPHCHDLHCHQNSDTHPHVCVSVSQKADEHGRVIAVNFWSRLRTTLRLVYHYALRFRLSLLPCPSCPLFCARDRGGRTLQTQTSLKHAMCMQV